MQIFLSLNTLNNFFFFNYWHGNNKLWLVQILQNLFASCTCTLDVLNCKSIYSKYKLLMWFTLSTTNHNLNPIDLTNKTVQMQMIINEDVGVWCHSILCHANFIFIMNFQCHFLRCHKNVLLFFILKIFLFLSFWNVSH